MASTKGSPHKSLRRRAWRNMMVAAVNEGLRRKLFSLRPGDNWWPGHDDSTRSCRGEPYVYSITFPGGIEALACVSDAGFDELSIHVALWPTGNEFVVCCNGGFNAGKAFANGWLERRDGMWLQNITDGLWCRRHLLHHIADIDIAPEGYSDSPIRQTLKFARH